MSRKSLQLYPPEFLALCQGLVKTTPEDAKQIKMQFGSKSKAKGVRSEFYQWRKLIVRELGTDYAESNGLYAVCVQEDPNDETGLIFSLRATQETSSVFRQAMEKAGLIEAEPPNATA